MNQLAFTTAELSREEPYYEASSGLEVSLFPSAASEVRLSLLLLGVCLIPLLKSLDLLPPSEPLLSAANETVDGEYPVVSESVDGQVPVVGRESSSVTSDGKREPGVSDSDRVTRSTSFRGLLKVWKFPVLEWNLQIECFHLLFRMEGLLDLAMDGGPPSL